MIDQMYDRAYQQARAALNRDIAAARGSIGSTIGDSLRALHRLEWSAPWRPQQKRA